MRLDWEKDDKGLHRYIAETAAYRFVMIAPPHRKPQLWVQRFSDDWGTKPIDQRSCLTRKHAERIAQRFEDSGKSRRLR
jgi:hypothetical protein